MKRFSILLITIIALSLSVASCDKSSSGDPGVYSDEYYGTAGTGGIKGTITCTEIEPDGDAGPNGETYDNFSVQIDDGEVLETNSSETGGGYEITELAPGEHTITFYDGCDSETESVSFTIIADKMKIYNYAW